MLTISDLHVAYGQSEVLHGLNVSVAPNEIVAIMGRNGMGKTTLMKSRPAWSCRASPRCLKISTSCSRCCWK